MKVIAVNGSPRKNWNTAEMLKSALDGAASCGAETKLVHLADMDFKGCVSCFACKLKTNPDMGRCGYRDALTPLLREIEGCTALILGSPIYIGDVTGMMRNFIERLTFQYISYDTDRTPYFKGHVNCGFIFTMNCPEQFADCQQYAYEKNTSCLGVLGGRTPEFIMANETLQWSDYSKYASGMFDVEAKQRIRREVWPKDLEKAFELGKRLVSE